VQAIPIGNTDHDGAIRRSQIHERLTFLIGEYHSVPTTGQEQMAF